MSFRTQMTIRWTDCDAAGIIYHANYYAFQDAALVEFLKTHESGWNELLQRYGAHFPRVESHCSYTAPATYGQVVEVELHVPNMTAKILTLGFRVIDQSTEQKLAEGYIKFAMVPISAAGEQPRAMVFPGELRQMFAELQP